MKGTENGKIFNIILMDSKYIQQQKDICKKSNQDFFTTSEELKIGISGNVSKLVIRAKIIFN